MELEVCFKGGVELRKFDPEKYDSFQEKICTLVMDTFPGVDGVFTSATLNDRHQEENISRKLKQSQGFKELLRGVMKEPEIQELIRKRMEKQGFAPKKASN